MSYNVWYMVGFGVGVTSTWLAYRYIKQRINDFVLSKIGEKINMAVDLTNEEDFFRPVHKNSAVLTFTSGGKRHQIFVPYNRKKSTRCLGQSVFLIRGEEEIDITQKPGVPYTVCADDLGGERIIVKNRAGEIIKNFDLGEIPYLF